MQTIHPKAREAPAAAENIRFRVLVPLIVGLLSLLTAFWLAFRNYVAQTRTEEAEAFAAEARHLFDHEIERSVAIMHNLLVPLSQQMTPVAAFRSGNRDLLYELNKASLEEMRELKITHFYFHRPDGTNFLRVHEPDHFDDKIGRKTLRDAMATGKETWGLEGGPIGRFVLRTVRPWKMSDETLGYLELGIEFADLSNLLHSHMDVEILLVAAKNRVDRQLWEKKAGALEAQWNKYSEVVPISQTIAEVPPPLAAIFRNLRVGETPPDQEISSGDKTWQAAFLPIRGPHGITAGYLCFLKDVSVEVASARRAQLTVGVICLIVTAALLAFLSVYLGSIEKDLKSKTASLEVEIGERKRKEQELRHAQETLETRVQERTRELTEANGRLREEISEKERARSELEQAQRELLEASHKAGMAEVATGMLHNVGNVLNSANVAAHVLSDKLRGSRVQNFMKAASILREHERDLATFLVSEEKGRALPKYLVGLAEHLDRERLEMLQEVGSLQDSVDHIRNIVNRQQEYARASGFLEKVDLAKIVDDAIELAGSQLGSKKLRIVREYEAKPRIMAEKHKLLQIFLNLINNAKQACRDAQVDNPTLWIRIRKMKDNYEIAVTDNGSGIAKDNMTRIFNYGFTTKKDGHGFGLHSAALAATEMRGRLWCESQGLMKGATFHLALPNPSDKKAEILN